MVKKQHYHVRFYRLLMVLMALIFFRYALQINIPRILSLAVITLIAVSGTRTEIIAMMMCLIPLHEVVDFYYSMTVVLAVYVLKYHRKIHINLSIILVMSMFFWELLHGFTSDIEPVSLLSAFIPMVLLSLLMSTDVQELDYAFVVHSMAVATISVCITMLGQVFAWSDYNVVAAISNLRRLGIISQEVSKSGISGGNIHPNSLGVICVLVTTGLLQLWSAGQHSKWSLPMVVTMLLFGALTSSRTFVACLLMMVFLFFCGLRGGIKKKIRFLVTVLLIAALVLILLNSFFPDLLQYYIKRFLVKDITTGRDDLMIQYHTFIIENNYVMLFGVGIQNYGEKLINIHRVASNVPHNSIQEVIVAWGIPGLILLAILCMAPIIHAYKYNRKLRVLNYIPLLIILFKSMAGQLLTSGYSLLALSYAYLSLTQDFSRREAQST